MMHILKALLVPARENLGQGGGVREQMTEWKSGV